MCSMTSPICKLTYYSFFGVFISLPPSSLGAISQSPISYSRLTTRYLKTNVLSGPPYPCTNVPSVLIPIPRRLYAFIYRTDRGRCCWHERGPAAQSESGNFAQRPESRHDGS